MKVLNGDFVVDNIRKLFERLNFNPPSLKDTDVSFCEKGTSGLESEILSIIDENVEIAEKGCRPLCQDCGAAHVNIKKGKQVTFSNAASLNSLVNEGVRQAYSRKNLRKSIVADPFSRKNTGDNTPVFIDYEETDGDVFEISGMVKGGGSDNVSAVRMLRPSQGREGVADFVVEVLSNARGSGCPPYFAGIGVGATFAYVTKLASKALMQKSCDDTELKNMISDRVEKLDFGVQGLPGNTALKAVFIKKAPTHIAMLPVSVMLNCHSYRCGYVNL